MYKINKIQKEKYMFQYILKIVHILVYIFIIPLLVISFILIIKSFQNTSEIPDIFGYKIFVIVSGSMEPNINKGDVIFIKEAKEQELEIGDIISFNDRGEIVTHRISNINNDEGKVLYITKGDNNKKEDRESISYDKIEGEYIFKLNGFGNFIKILQNKIVLILLFTILILNYLYMKRINKRKKKREEKRIKYKQKRIEEEKV